MLFTENFGMVTLPGICGMGISFVFDNFRVTYALVGAIIWLICTLFSLEYIKNRKNKSRYWLFLALTLIATEGVFLSGDLFTTFIFFEMMSLTSYVWILQDETREALRAADTYIAVAVTAGMVMLMGLFMLYRECQTLTISELHGAFVNSSHPGVIWAAGLCMFVGFGAKAGAFGLHIWLPEGYRMSPAPATALLSAMLTKTGIYGILVLCATVFAGSDSYARFICAMGAVTMFVGGCLAIFAVDLKKTLAFSSMSQIGFILTGLGMTAYLDAEGALAAGGSFMHMLNHTFVKTILFLAAGYVFFSAGSYDLNTVRGFGRKNNILRLSFLAGVLSLAGVPGFGGYVSKTGIHEAILESGMDPFFKGVEVVFLLTGGMTLAYMLKIFVAVFVEKNSDETLQKKYDDRTGCMSGPALGLIAVSALILVGWGISIQDIKLFDFECMKGALISISTGIVLYVIVVRGLFIRKNGAGTEYADRWPEWLNLENYIYRPFFLSVLPGVCGIVCRALDCLVDTIVVILRKTVYRDIVVRHERPEGNFLTEGVGRTLNAYTKIYNRLSQKPGNGKDYVHRMALFQLRVSETVNIISRSMSYGLMIFGVGFLAVLVYLIYFI